MFLWDSGISFSSDICPKVALQDHMIVLFLIFWGTSILFSIVAALIYITTDCIQGSVSPHSLQPLSLTLLIIAILTGVWWYLIVVLICISLMINDAEYLFMYLLAIWVSSLKKMCTSVFHPFFKSNYLFLLLLNCMNSLYILDINTSLDMWFTNIFNIFHMLPFHFVNCLLCCEEDF